MERGVLRDGLPSGPVLGAGVGGEVLEAMLTWDAVHSIIPVKAPELTGARSPRCGKGREERFFSSSAVERPPGVLCIVFLTQQHNLFFSSHLGSKCYLLGWAGKQLPEGGWEAGERRTSWERQRGGCLQAEVRARAASKDLGDVERAQQWEHCNCSLPGAC